MMCPQLTHHRQLCRENAQSLSCSESTFSGVCATNSTPGTVEKEKRENVKNTGFRDENDVFRWVATTNTKVTVEKEKRENVKTIALLAARREGLRRKNAKT